MKHILFSFVTICAILFTPLQSCGEVVTVVISGNGSGLNITIKRGDTVRWLNRLNGITIFSPDEKFPSSPILSSGDIYKVKFDKAGIYYYRVSAVKYGTGTIIVK